MLLLGLICVSPWASGSTWARPSAKPTEKLVAPVQTESAELTDEEREKEHEQEYLIKAAYLHHFLKYTTWPEAKKGEKQRSLRLVVVGTDPFGEILDRSFKDKKIQGRSVTLIRQEELEEDLLADMIFAGGLEEEQRLGLLEACKGKPILVVGEVTGFAEAGAHCNLYRDGKNVKFEINTDVVKESKLTMSSELLKLARLVKFKKKGSKK